MGASGPVPAATWLPRPACAAIIPAPTVAPVASSIRLERRAAPADLAQTWIPHSVLSLPAQRPSRPDPGRVQGMQPIDS